MPEPRFQLEIVDAQRVTIDHRTKTVTLIGGRIGPLDNVVRLPAGWVFDLTRSDA